MCVCYVNGDTNVSIVQPLGCLLHISQTDGCEDSIEPLGLSGKFGRCHLVQYTKLTRKDT